jgi:predicted nucleic acid-binding Zn ribbon protein
VPVYVFRCPACGRENEELLPLGATDPRPCLSEDCSGTRTLRLSRVAVSYNSFGFTTTDSLVDNPQGKNFKTLKEKATEIADS